MLASLLWPLGLGIYLGVLLLVAALALWIALFILAQPLAMLIGIRRARQRFIAQRDSRSDDDSRTRCE